ncbi:MAG: hypothetical protein RLO52_40670 [Sandaracinaceae bacterium]|nr:MAG: hypothetical protein EVA89_22205 [Sandaracinaceae bacterium]
MRAQTLLIALLLGACGGASSTTPTPETTQPEARYDRLPRLRFNQLAVRLDLPVFWAADADEDGAVDPGEVRALAFYPSAGEWVRDGAFTPAFDQAYAAIVAAADDAPADARQGFVFAELDSIAPTLIENDLREMPDTHRAFAGHMVRVAAMIDALYAKQVGMEALADRIADDPASRSLFRRNWGPRCRAPETETEEACSAIEGAPDQPVDVYPTSLQAQDDFCQALEGRENASALLTPFTVVREREGELVAVPYHEAYADYVQPIATELRAAATAMTDPEEEPLRRYLLAAAQSFLDDDWDPANEAWAAMNVRNSRWYVRVGPDEVYWDPCSHKAGFHLTFARINQGSLEWQDRLTPLQQQMERSLASLSEAYEPRDVSFHLPDFIDIVVNAGDDRDPFGATIGQSLPNWGPVAEEGRGRTVAMTNLYTDPDSLARRREVAASLFTEAAMAAYTDDTTPALLNTILHEATHNLGPSHEYRVNGQTDAEAFGGGLSSMLEELKAQSGALYFVEMLREEGVLTDAQAREIYLDGMVWALGHISRGMYTPTGQRKAYSQLAAVQVGFLMDRGALRWDPEATAANGEDTGAFDIDYEAFPGAVNALMTAVLGIKATADRAAAEEIAARYVDGDVVPQEVVVERHRRHPRASFVYTLTL